MTTRLGQIRKVKFEADVEAGIIQRVEVKYNYVQR
jgi:hypothetical protein